jgi:transcriptional regulator with XRE-family HTH domain
MSFGMNLKNIREGAKMTQAQLGQLAKLDVSQISRIERGSSKPELDTIKRIAIALSCSTDDLIFDQGEREPTAELKLLFERVSQLPDDRKALVKEFLLAIIQRAEAQEMLSK